jgi:hypothetical protein
MRNVSLLRHTLLHYLTLGLFGLLVLLPNTSAHAQDGQQVGLVIRHGNGNVITQCVEIDDAMVSGYDVLAASGLDLSVDFQSMGTAICRIDQEGCGFPGENCFCQCMSSPCIYWSYWQLEDGAWRYSDGGAANTRVQAGSVEGWSWGEGIVGVEADNQPPLHTFAEICGDGDSAEANAQAHTPPTVVDPEKDGAQTPTDNETESSEITGTEQASGEGNSVAQPTATVAVSAVALTAVDAQPEAERTASPATASGDAVAPLRPVYAGLALVFGGPLLVGALAFFVIQMRKRENS